ncbi:MAG: riboflavin synthase [Vicinamibacterales bacterium]
MFTGLIEAEGTVAGLVPAPGGFRIRIATPLAGALAVGESLAVSGVCLTVLATDGGDVLADIGPETARVTTLGALQAGDRVNLERAMRTDGRLGGHFVLGHVDGVGTVEEVRPDGDSHWVAVAFPDDLAAYFIPKGSVAVDGISLTVAALGLKRFEVMVIPHTWRHTTLGARRPGDRVNLECDMVGKYVVRSLELRQQA